MFAKVGQLQHQTNLLEQSRKHTAHACFLDVSFCLSGLSEMLQALVLHAEDEVMCASKERLWPYDSNLPKLCATMQGRSSILMSDWKALACSETFSTCFSSFFRLPASPSSLAVAM